MELSVIGIIGIGVELTSSELELNCLGDFVPELELLLSEWELNCKNGIDSDSQVRLSRRRSGFDPRQVRTRVLHEPGLGPLAGPRNFLSTLVPGSGCFQLTNLMGYS